MKSLPKHLRPRWRYLGVVIEAWADADLERESFQRALWYAAGNLLGDPGSADCDLRVFRFAFADGAGHAVVRVRRGEVERGRAALACVDAVDGQPVRVAVRGVSGTVRACEERHLPGAGVPTEQHAVAVEGVERPAVRRGDRLDVETDDGYLGATREDYQ
jgi:ribonuclease P/MRP protein subunit POP5